MEPDVTEVAINRIDEIMQQHMTSWATCGYRLMGLSVLGSCSVSERPSYRTANSHHG